MDNDVVCEDRSELQRRKFEVVVFLLEVEVELGELEELVEDFVKAGLYAVGEELEFDPLKTADAKEFLSFGKI